MFSLLSRPLEPVAQICLTNQLARITDTSDEIRTTRLKKREHQDTAKKVNLILRRRIQQTHRYTSISFIPNNKALGKNAGYRPVNKYILESQRTLGEDIDRTKSLSAIG